MQTFNLTILLISSCLIAGSYAQCSSKVVNSFGGTETVSKNALGQLSSDDGSTQAVSIVNGRLIIQTKPNIAGSWFTDVDAGCANVTSENYDQVEVVWSNSSPSTLVISVLWGADDNACQTRTWTETSGAPDSGVIGDASKTTTFSLTPAMKSRLHTIFLGLPAQESATTYSIRSIRLIQSGPCPVAAAKSAKSTNTASFSFSMAFVIFLVTATFTSMMFLQ